MLLKQAVSTAPMLAHVNWFRKMAIAVDASTTGTGALLFQPEDNTYEITPYNIVAICSRKWSDAETRYSTYKKELRGVVYGLTKFHTWIYGRIVYLITDHKPLIYMLYQPQLSQALSQWWDIIQQYTLKVIHRPGVLHVQPDNISRLFGTVYEDAKKVWGVAKNIEFLKNSLTPESHF